VHPLGVEHFGQTGTVADLYRHFGIDSGSIRSAAERISRDQRTPFKIVR
jgi:pyruvate dehydrogenase E1 component